MSETQNEPWYRELENHSTPPWYNERATTPEEVTSVTLDIPIKGLLFYMDYDFTRPDESGKMVNIERDEHIDQKIKDMLIEKGTLDPEIMGDIAVSMNMLTFVYDLDDMEDTQRRFNELQNNGNPQFPISFRRENMWNVSMRIPNHAEVIRRIRTWDPTRANTWTIKN